MPVLLVNPDFDGRAEVPPLGLLCLASALAEEGIESRVIDLDVPSLKDPCRELQEAIACYTPSVLGVTATSRNVGSAAAVFRMAKKSSPSMATVLGGVHATVAFRGLLEDFPDIDFLVRGEGENSLPGLISCLKEKGDLKSIEGLSFRENGNIVHNPRGKPADLASHPVPAHDLIESGIYKARSISSSRGCPHGCTFCSIREMYGSAVRFRPIGRVLEEISVLRECGTRRIMFTDDNFTADPKRLRELCGQLDKNGLSGGIEFIAQGRLDDIAHNPISAEVLGNAGFRYIYAGAESGSQGVLDYYHKKAILDEIFEGALHCITNNVMPIINFIIFGPHDDVGTLRETIAFARRLFESGAQISYTETLVPYHGTPIRRQLEQEGRFVGSGDICWFKPLGRNGL